MSESATPLTILHVTLRAVLGGVTRHISDLGTQSIRRGHRVLAAGAPGPWGTLLSEDGIPWQDLPLTGGPLKLWSSAGQINRIIRQERVDIIHCHFRRPVMAARLASWRGGFRLPVVFTLHLAPVPITGLQGWFSDWGDMLIAPSEEAKHWVTQTAGLDGKQVSLIPHGVCPDRWTVTDDASRRGARARFNLSDDSVVAAYVGRFQYPKNEDWILDVVIESRKRGLNVQFIMCGEGPHGDALRQRAREHGLEQVICWPGYIDPLPVYHASDLLLLPSSIEGFAYVAAEAASCGNAVLRTRTAGWHETVRPGETGRVVDIDRDAFVKAAVEMLADPAELRRLGARGSAMVRSKLTLDNQVEQTLNIYRRAITESKATG